MHDGRVHGPGRLKIASGLAVVKLAVVSKKAGHLQGLPEAAFVFFFLQGKNDGRTCNKNPEVAPSMYQTLLLIFLSGVVTHGFADQPGPLVIVGGGKMPPQAEARFLQLAGGKDARIVVLAQASSRTDRGTAATRSFSERGAAKVDNLRLEDLSRARQILGQASGIWFPGGSQKQLYEALEKKKLLQQIRTRYLAGVACGGTSAGAAILSERMITQSPKKAALVQGNTPVQQGLGLIPELIIDQHFLARHRMDRLLGAVLDSPDRIGVGISESTAIVVQQDRCTVLGKGSVVVIDARRAKLEPAKKGALQSGSGIDISLYRAGQSFRFKP